MNVNEITLFTPSEDGKKNYQTYRTGVSRSTLFKVGKSYPKVNQIKLNDQSGVVEISFEDTDLKLYYQDVPCRFIA